MQRLLKYIVPVSLALSAMAIVACGKSGGGGFNGIGGNGVVSNVIPPGTKVGFVAQNTKAQEVTPDLGSYMTLGAGAKTMLKYAMGVCDRENTNIGLANCNAWMDGFHDIMLFADGSQTNRVKMVVRAFPDTRCTGNSCGYYSATLPSIGEFVRSLFGFPAGNMAGFYNPMVLDMTIWPINNSQGFELQGYGPSGAYFGMGRNLLFQFQVAQGKLEDAAWNFKLYYNGINGLVYYGHMVRCNTQNCGVQGF
jgi:hypothetical protein